MGKSAGRVAATALSFAAVVLLNGCGQNAKGPVTGKVTVDDRPVRSGQLTFIGGPTDAKQVIVIGFDGKYTIELPPGEYKVGVEGGTGQSDAARMAHVPIPKAPKDVPVMKDPSGLVGGETVDLAKEMKNPVVVPMRYRPPESSGFKVTVPAGGVAFNIPMTSKK
jgi:hypothetical protein